jgi:hypothetical protein
VTLVGREQVLTDLAAVLEEARQGRGSLVLITGEPGIGKTRVAEELTRRADGFSVHWSWCTSERSSGSLRPWALVLRALAGSHAAVAERVQGSVHLSALLAGTAVAHDDHEISRALLSDDLMQVLVTTAQTTPLLLVLDDLHDAQLSTLRLLADLAGAVRTCPLVVVGTARDGVHEWQGREQVRGELLGQVRRVALGPLEAQDVRELLDDDDPVRLQELLERTGGNALLVTEMARAVDGIPASLRAMVAARTARLPTDSRRLVEAASVLGARFRLDVLADVADVPLDTVAGHLTDLVTVETAGRARFTHELLRDAVYAELSPADQQRWHARAGATLAALHRRGREVEAAEVASHLLQSGSPEAAPAALEAARRAAGLSAFDDAVRWYDEALALLTDPTERTGVLLERARAQRGCGDGAGARASLLQATNLAPTPEQHAVAALAMGTGAGGFEVDARDGQQLAELEKALVALPADALSLRASVLARLSVARYHVSTPEESHAQATEAVDLARASGDPSALAGALAALCDAMAGPQWVGERLEHAAEIVRLAGDNLEIELLGRRLRVVALMELGDRHGAEQETAAYGIKAEALRHPLYLWYVPLWRGFWALAEGRYEDSKAASEEASQIGAGSENAWMLVTTQTWCRLEQTGDGAGLKQLFEDNNFNELQDTWAVLAQALGLRQQGRTEDAWAKLDTISGVVMELRRDSEWLATMAQACLLLDGRDHPLCAELYDALLPYAHLFVIEGIGAATRGPVHRFLAMVAPSRSLAKEHRAASDEACRRFGATALLSAPTSSAAEACWVLEGDTWLVSYGGATARVRDSKGMRDLATLLAAQGKEIGALDLYGAETPLEHDTGEVLDSTAREAYKRRLRELSDAGSLSPEEAVEQQFLLDQLASAYGLGGRVRRTGSSAERARSAVTARIRETIRRVADLEPVLGRHLKAAVRTGTFCSYAPETPVDWRLTP